LYKFFIDEIELVSISNDIRDDYPSTSAMASAENIQYVENLSTYFESVEISSILKDVNKVLFFRLKIKDVSCKPSIAELEEIAQKCAKNSIIILLFTKNDNKFLLYWKSKKIQHFMILKLCTDFDLYNNLKLFEFVTKFLINSLKREHLGKFCLKFYFLKLSIL